MKNDRKTKNELIAELESVRKEMNALEKQVGERKKPEQEIENVAKFPAENPFPILRLKPDGIILYANEASQALLRQWGCIVGGYAPKFWCDLAKESFDDQSRKTVDVGCGQQVYSLTIVPISDDGYVNLYGADITERKRAEKQITLLAHTVKSIIECVSITDMNDKTLFVNEAFLTTYGYDEREILGKDITIVRLPNNPPEVLRGIREATLSGGWRGEVMNRTKDGREFPVLLSTSSVRDDMGQVVGLVGVATDITERKLAEQETESLSRFPSENPNPILRVESDGQLIYANPASEALLRLWNCTVGEYLPPDWRERVVNVARNSTHTIAEVECEEWVYSIMIVPISDLGYVNLYGRDITERKRAQEELEKNEEKYRNIFENVQDVYYQTLFDGTVLEVSPSIEILSKGQYHRADVMGRSMFEFYNDPKDRDAIIAAIQKTSSVSDFEVTFKNRDGSLISCSISAKISFNAEGRPEKIIGSMHNITERKQAEEALQESETRYRSVLQSATDAIVTADSSGIIVGWNSGAERIFGYNYTEAVGQPLTSIIPLYHHAGHPNGMKGLQSEGDQDVIGKTVELEGFRRDKNVFPIELSLSTWETKSEQFFTGIIRDITERKRIEERLLYEQSLLRAIMDNMPDRVYFKDKESGFLRISRSLANIFGLDDPAQTVGKTDFDFFSEEHARVSLEDEQKIMKSGIAIVGVEEKESWPDGRQTWVSTTKVPFRDAQGEITGTFGISRDITERKRAEQELIIANKELVFQNEEKEKRATELIVANKELVFQNEEKEKRAAELIIANKELLFQNEEKEKRAAELIIANKELVFQNEERKRAEETKRGLEAQLQQAQKLESVGTLASGIAHDFNNILGIILGHSTLLERLREDPQRYAGSVAAITKATQRGASLVKQLLIFARKTEALLESVKVNDIITEIAKLMQETFPKTITISTTLQRDLPVIVADASQIHQVLLNLFVNARDAMPNFGTLSISTGTIDGKAVSSRFSKATARQYVQIEVTDTGIGMDEATRQRIFEPFFTTKGPGKGTGLGLAVVFGIVEHHNGFIDVRSKPGEGTSFTVYLPITERAPEIRQRVRKSLEEIPGGTETILVIEDEEMLKDLVKVSLVSKGYTVLAAEDGIQGVEMYQSHHKEIAVVLSDFGLPLLSGQDVFRKIREINPVAKVILASGLLEPEAKSEMFKAGLKNFIQKPYMQDEVLQKIREAIDTNT